MPIRHLPWSMNHKRSSLFAAAAAALSLGLIGGCSLTSIVDVKVRECSAGPGPEGDAQCRAANNVAGQEDCANWECVNNGDYDECQPILEERCDGEDNDCDGLIDEPPDGGSTLLVAEQERIAEEVSDADSATVAMSESISRVYVQYEQKNDSGVFAVGLEAGEAPAVKPRTQAPPPGTQEEQTYIELTDGCHVPGTNTPSASCNAQQSVVAAGKDVGFYASLNTQGCAAGELHLGVIDPERPAEFVDRGRGFRSPSYKGVMAGSSRCSSNGTSACEELKEAVSRGEGNSSDLGKVCGVSQLAIGAIEEQALVSYLGIGKGNSSCDATDPVSVLGLMVHDREGNRNGKFHWGDPSGEGVPELLGTTTAAAPPAVLGIENSGFLVAFSDAEADGAVQLSWLPNQGNGFVQQEHQNTGVLCPDKDCDARQGEVTKPIDGVPTKVMVDFATKPLEGFESLTSIAPKGAAADGIRLSWLSLSEEEAAVAVTWIEGCYAGPNVPDKYPAYLRIVRLGLSEDGIEILSQGPVVSLGETQEIPIAVPSTSAFVIEGHTDGDVEVGADERGGFYAVTKDRIAQAIRISVATGKRIHSEETIEVDDVSEDYLAPLQSNEYVSYIDGELLKRTFTCGE